MSIFFHCIIFYSLNLTHSTVKSLLYLFSLICYLGLSFCLSLLSGLKTSSQSHSSSRTYTQSNSSLLSSWPVLGFHCCRVGGGVGEGRPVFRFASIPTMHGMGSRVDSGLLDWKGQRFQGRRKEGRRKRGSRRTNLEKIGRRDEQSNTSRTTSRSKVPLVLSVRELNLSLVTNRGPKRTIFLIYR